MIYFLYHDQIRDGLHSLSLIQIDKPITSYLILSVIQINRGMLKIMTCSELIYGIIINKRY